jgi:hypothetical protein
VLIFIAKIIIGTIICKRAHRPQISAIGPATSESASDGSAGGQDKIFVYAFTDSVRLWRAWSMCLRQIRVEPGAPGRELDVISAGFIGGSCDGRRGYMVARCSRDAPRPRSALLPSRDLSLVGQAPPRAAFDFSVIQRVVVTYTSGRSSLTRAVCLPVKNERRAAGGPALVGGAGLCYIIRVSA